MKRLISVILFMLLSSVAFTATPPTEFTMSRPTTTYAPQVTIKVTMKVQAVYDSIVITTAGDSLAGSGSYIANLDTTGVTWTAGSLNTWYISSLTPNTSYKWMVRVFKTSPTYTNSDTLSTLPILHIGDGVPESQGSLMGVPMLRWDTYLPYSIRNSSVLLTSSADTDSTCFYNPWKYTNITVKATGDSCACTALIYAGYTGSDESVPRVTLVDSLNITEAGIYNSGTLTLPPTYGFYVKWRGDTDCGYTTLTTWLNRNRD